MTFTLDWRNGFIMQKVSGGWCVHRLPDGLRSSSIFFPVYGETEHLLWESVPCASIERTEDSNATHRSALGVYGTALSSLLWNMQLHYFYHFTMNWPGLWDRDLWDAHCHCSSVPLPSGAPDRKSKQNKRNQAKSKGVYTHFGIVYRKIQIKKYCMWLNFFVLHVRDVLLYSNICLI